MVDRPIRGVTKSQEVLHRELSRDTTPLFRKGYNWLTIKQNLMLVLIGLAAVAFIVPGVSDILFVVALCFTWFGLTRQENAPFKLPIQSKMLDRNELNPKDNSPSMAEGIFFMGNELVSGKEAWLTNSDCRQHFLVLGTTGAGKTEALVGFAANAVLWGSGCLYCDGKGDVALFTKLYALCKRFNRLDDLLVLNYMTGNADVGAGGGHIRSNTLNPFATGSSDNLTQLVVSLMDDAGGDGAMWKGRAQAMFTGVCRALVTLRDQGVIDLNINEIREHLDLKRIIDLASKEKFPNLPSHIRLSIKSYLTSLPGFQEDKGYKQGTTTLDQHGFLQMQFSRICGTLSDVYGHIFKTPYGEIDMADVVLNRRILVIMLPALEMASDELANLGKIIVATLKGMMGGTLGSKIEGTYSEVVENRVTNSPSPYVVILDEVGYYMVDGMNLMSAQARSLGFALFFAGQDINAMRQFNEKVFGSVQGNTNTKIFMRTEDPETVELAVKAGGKAYRAQSTRYDASFSELGGRRYRDNNEAAVEEVDRINPLDLKAQNSGEMTIIHQEHIVRVKSFFANPQASIDERAMNLRTNHFITVERPSIAEIEQDQRLPEIMQRFLNPAFAEQMVLDATNSAEELQGELQSIATVTKLLQEKKPLLKGAIDESAVILAYVRRENKDLTDRHTKSISNSLSQRSSLNKGLLKRDEMLAAPMPSDELEFPDSILDDQLADEVQFSKPTRRPSREHRSSLSRVNKDVLHGVQVDNGPVHEMANKITSNEEMMKTLQALDYNYAEETPETVGARIDQVFVDETAAYDPVTSDGMGKASIDDFERTSQALTKAMPDFATDNGAQANTPKSHMQDLLQGLLDDE